jgi:hypothetical protein
MSDSPAQSLPSRPLLIVGRRRGGVQWTAEVAK